MVLGSIDWTLSQGSPEQFWPREHVNVIIYNSQHKCRIFKSMHVKCIEPVFSISLILKINHLNTHTHTCTHTHTHTHTHKTHAQCHTHARLHTHTLLRSVAVMSINTFLVLRVIRVWSPGVRIVGEKELERREGGREGGREGEREEGGREGGREVGKREGGREGEREGGKKGEKWGKRLLSVPSLILCKWQVTKGQYIAHPQYGWEQMQLFLSQLWVFKHFPPRLSTHP